MFIKKAKESKKFRSLTPPPVKQSKSKLAIEEYPQSPPSLWIEVEVPELQNMKVGVPFTATMKCTLSSIEKRVMNDKTVKYSYRIDVKEMAVN